MMESQLVEDQEFHISWETHRLFLALDHNGTGTVSTHFILEFLERTGIERTDKRLAGLVAAMDKLGGPGHDYEMSLDDFASATSSCNTLFNRIVTGKLRVPNFEGLR
jgi:hypothetical protein